MKTEVAPHQQHAPPPPGAKEMRKRGKAAAMLLTVSALVEEFRQQENWPARVSSAVRRRPLPLPASSSSDALAADGEGRASGGAGPAPNEAGKATANKNNSGTSGSNTNEEDDTDAGWFVTLTAGCLAGFMAVFLVSAYLRRRYCQRGDNGSHHPGHHHHEYEPVHYDVDGQHLTSTDEDIMEGEEEEVQCSPLGFHCRVVTAS